MILEGKELLLKDLCARLPYGVKCHFKYGTAEDVIILKCIDGDTARFNYGWYGRFHVMVEPKYIKPYLRQMSSMTEEESKELDETLQYTQRTLESYDWLNAHHFDYRGLIGKGLAIEAPEGMYDN